MEIHCPLPWASTAPAGDSGRERRPLCSCVVCNEMLCMPSLHPHEWQQLDWDKTEMKAQQNTDAMLTPEEQFGGVFFVSWRSWQRKSNLVRWAIMQSSSGRDGKSYQWQDASELNTIKMKSCDTTEARPALSVSCWWPWHPSLARWQRERRRVITKTLQGCQRDEWLALVSWRRGRWITRRGRDKWCRSEASKGKQSHKIWSNYYYSTPGCSVFH